MGRERQREREREREIGHNDRQNNIIKFDKNGTSVSVSREATLSQRAQTYRDPREQSEWYCLMVIYFLVN